MMVVGFILFALAAIPFVLTLMNLSTLSATPRHAPRGHVLVSILIPARNEAKNIGPALDAALGSEAISGYSAQSLEQMRSDRAVASSF